MNAERCRYENHRQEERERQRVERRRERCRRRAWYDPRRWLCSIVTFMESIWVTVVHTIRVLVCTVAEILEEIARIVANILAALLAALDNVVGVLTGNNTGYWPIVDSIQRDVPSVPRLTASSRSIIRTIDEAGLETHTAYSEEGIRVEIELRAGRAYLREGNGDFQPLLPARADYPPFAPSDAVSDRQLAVSYDFNRLGDWRDPGLFDMVAAGGDRLMAKVQGSDEIYLLILGDPYVHQPAGQAPMRLPQTFFKLDPKVGLANADPTERLRHVRVAGDDETHLATERFPLIRWLFGAQPNPIRPPVDLMVAWFAPNIWLKVDGRPRRDTHEPPVGYPTYRHVVYRSNLPRSFTLSTEVGKRSIRYSRVLDLAIGVSHLHEQHSAPFGGEADSLSGKGGTFGRALESVRTALFGSAAFEAAYRYANGPMQDYGGWLDGTCIYYMMVQLKSDAMIASGDHRDAFAVLWADEQFAFTERWRLLHIYERDYTSPFQPIVGEISRLEEEYHRDHPFDGDRYFCPFQEGHVRAWSRMAAARQHVVVSGIDGEQQAHELYSIHWAWGTMDKTWRRRRLPAVLPLTSDQRPAKPRVELDSLALRGDATIMLSGADEVDGVLVPGRWTQRVLPCDGQEQPSIEGLRLEPSLSPRVGGYSHPWRFVAEAAAGHLDRCYSHYGVLEAVDSRVQCYLIDHLDLGALSTDEIESLVWVDADDRLRIDHQRLDYAEVARTLDGGTLAQRGFRGVMEGVFSGDASLMPAVANRSTRPSRYHRHVLLRLRHVAGLGWIALWADKRDDKTRALDAVGDATIRLLPESKSSSEIQLRGLRHLRNDRDPHGARVGLEPDAISPPMVRRATVTTTRTPAGLVDRVRIALQFARDPADRRHGALETFEQWSALNVMRIRVAAVEANATIDLLTVDRGVQQPLGGDPTIQVFDWRPAAGANHAMLSNLLTARAAVLSGTSLWCVGATGLVAAPDLVEWA